MSEYELLARYYDRFMEDIEPHEGIEELVRERGPDRGKLLDIACGTAKLLESFENSFELYGIDTSREMLSRAEKRLPSATLLKADMSTFEIDEMFDLALCVFDSINHLLSFDEWKETFGRVEEHLKEGGELHI